MGARAKTIIKEDPADLAHAAAKIFAVSARDSVSQNGRFIVALSGGSTPRLTHRILGQEPYVKEIPWEKTYLFWVDDRCVPEFSPANNYGTAKKDFLERVPIPLEQVHPMPVGAPPERGASMYQNELETFFRRHGDELPVFDLIFLGIGEDGHTASLFPGQRALEEKEKWVVAVKGGNPDLRRLTMTYTVLNRARQLIFLVSGKEKAAIVRAVFEPVEPPFPAQKIRPVHGTLVWLLDRDAASFLPGVLSRDQSQRAPNSP
jgi:6-phosphogluconolactonase